MEYVIDEKGKWQRKGIFKALVEPSTEYLQLQKLNSLLTPEFKEPVVSSAEVQLAHFIIDITKRLEELEGGSL